ncbi:hypothetical protein CKO12_04265 [Chromatium okenii]|nr:hypothetical protein [Chromatium okenii]
MNKSKLAVTVCAAFILTVQLSVPEQPPPLQPVNTELLSAVAERVMLPFNVAEQILPQLIPAGLLLTLPLPVPDVLTVN